MRRMRRSVPTLPSLTFGGKQPYSLTTGLARQIRHRNSCRTGFWRPVFQEQGAGSSFFFCVLAGVPVWVFLLCFPSADAGSPVFLYFPSRPGRIILPCLGVPNEPWRANCELRVFCLGLASPTGHWGPRSGNSALHTRCVRVMDQC